MKLNLNLIRKLLHTASVPSSPRGETASEVEAERMNPSPHDQKCKKTYFKSFVTSRNFGCFASTINSNSTISTLLK